MHSKLRTLLMMVLLVILLGGTTILYQALSASYKDQPSTEDNNNSVTEQIQLSDSLTSTQENQKNLAPDFTVLNLEGNEVSLYDYIGKPIVLNFWASWCPPCKSEMPHFNNAYLKNKDEVTFLLVDLVDGQRETIDAGKEYIASQGYTFPIYFDTTQSAAYAYEIYSIPSTFFIDKEGFIVSSYQGALDEKTLIKYIEQIK